MTVVLDTRYSEAARSRAECVPLAMLAACYVAAEIVLPIVLASVLSLVLRPAMRVFERVYAPRGIAAILLILFALRHACRVGDGAVGAGRQLGAEIAYRDSRIGGAP